MHPAVGARSSGVPLRPIGRELPRGGAGRGFWPGGHHLSGGRLHAEGACEGWAVEVDYRRPVDHRFVYGERIVRHVRRSGSREEVGATVRGDDHAPLVDFDDRHLAAPVRGLRGEGGESERQEEWYQEQPPCFCRLCRHCTALSVSYSTSGSSNPATTGAWSDGFSQLLGSLSIAHDRAKAASAGETST